MELLKALWILIPIGIYVFFTQASKRARENATAWWWVVVVVIGVAGFLYELISTGRLGEPPGM